MLKSTLQGTLSPFEEYEPFQNLLGGHQKTRSGKLLPWITGRLSNALAAHQKRRARHKAKVARMMKAREDEITAVRSAVFEHRAALIGRVYRLQRGIGITDGLIQHGSLRVPVRGPAAASGRHVVIREITISGQIMVEPAKHVLD